jgi:hypothetical protein
MESSTAKINTWFKLFRGKLAASFVPDARGGMYVNVQISTNGLKSLNFFKFQQGGVNQKFSPGELRHDEAAVKQNVASTLRKVVLAPTLALPGGIDNVKIRLGFAGDPSGGSFGLNDD